MQFIFCVLLLLRSTSPTCRSHPEVVLHCCPDLLVLVLAGVPYRHSAVLGPMARLATSMACHVVVASFSFCFALVSLAFVALARSIAFGS